MCTLHKQYYVVVPTFSQKKIAIRVTYAKGCAWNVGRNITTSPPPFFPPLSLFISHYGNSFPPPSCRLPRLKKKKCAGRNFGKTSVAKGGEGKKILLHTILRTSLSLSLSPLTSAEIPAIRFMLTTSREEGGGGREGIEVRGRRWAT